MNSHTSGYPIIKYNSLEYTRIAYNTRNNPESYVYALKCELYLLEAFLDSDDLYLLRIEGKQHEVGQPRGLPGRCTHATGPLYAETPWWLVQPETGESTKLLDMQAILGKHSSMRCEPEENSVLDVGLRYDTT